MQSLHLSPQCPGPCSPRSPVAAEEDGGVLTQQRWDANSVRAAAIAVVRFLVPNTCMHGAGRAPRVADLESHGLFDDSKAEIKLCVSCVQTHLT